MMRINKKEHGTKKCSQNNRINPKTGKFYSCAFKKRTVQYYLLGLYDESAIWKKWHVNRHLLRQWRQWYYKVYEQPYLKPATNETAITARISSLTGSNQATRKTIDSKRKSLAQGTSEKSSAGSFARNRRTGISTTEKCTKKNWRQGVDEIKKSHPYYSIQLLCASYGKSRQAYYKAVQEANQEAYFADLIEEQVKRIRQSLPRCGAVKLYGIIKPFLKQHGIKKGRDKFKEVLRAKNLMLKKKKRTRKTTNSNHAFRKYPNLTLNLSAKCANHLWVSDITYIHFGTNNFFYLSLIMDAYSRKIVGWNLSDSLKAEGAIAALKMALSTLPPNHQLNSNLVHHSDRGIQYCCNEYIRILQKNNIKISMTQNGDPYENILAERINKTIKEEFLDEFLFANFEQAQRAVNRSIKNYNGLRPHASLDYLTPNQAHHLKCILKKHWKNPSYKKNKPKSVNQLKNKNKKSA